MSICTSIQNLGYSLKATIETLERPQPWHKIIEIGPCGLVWAEREVMAVRKCRGGWEVIFRRFGASGWYPETNVRNLKNIEP